MIQSLSEGAFQYDFSWATAAWFFFAVFLLDYFDISLPRGDSIAVSGALTAAAVIILGPLPSGPVGASLVCLSAACLAQAVRRGTHSPQRFSVSLIARIVALALASLALVLLEGSGFGPSAFVVQFAVPAVFLLGELLAAQAAAASATHRPFARLLRGNLAVQFPLLLAQWSASVLLLMTFSSMNNWSLIPVVALLFLIRQSYAMLLDIRETYQTTVEVLVEAAEGHDPRLVGHAERTAAIARSVAMHCGLSASRVELISYAALLHDIDAIGDGAESPTGSPAAAIRGHSSTVFEGVHFFEDVIPILRVCDGDPGQRSLATEADLMAGFIVALASDADSAGHLEVAEAHVHSVVARVGPLVSSSTKSLAVASALSLGYQIPAVP